MGMTATAIADAEVKTAEMKHVATQSNRSAIRGSCNSRLARGLRVVVKAFSSLFEQCQSFRAPCQLIFTKLTDYSSSILDLSHQPFNFEPDAGND